MMNLNNKQKDRFFQEMKELCGKYGIVPNNLGKTEVEIKKNEIFKNLENENFTRFTNSIGIVDGGEVIKTVYYYFNSINDFPDSYKERFAYDYPTGEILETKVEKEKWRIKVKFRYHAHFMVYVRDMQESTYNNFIENRKEYTEKTFEEIVEKIF